MKAARERAPDAGGSTGSESWTVLRLMRWSGAYLEEKGVARGRLDAEHLLAEALGMDRLQLYLQFERPLTREELDRFRPLLRRRAGREPLQYILGRAAFRELELAVDGRVLVPRPETEVLVDEVLRWAALDGRRGLTALDLGTGSGAIALSLAAEGPFAQVVATDRSPGALEVAGANAVATGLAERVELRLGDLFAPIDRGERFDVVVSNPPYVAERDAGDLEPEVAAWEPAEALFAGPDGLRVLRGIVERASAHVAPTGLLALEIDPRQAEWVAQALGETGQYEDVRVRRDLAGRRRVVLADRAAADDVQPER